MTNYKLELPDDFDDYSWEVESKGWFSLAVAEIDNNRYEINFYDPVRLSQEIESEFEYTSSVFYEKNLLIIPTVDRIHMEKAIEEIVNSKRYLEMVAIESA